MNSTTTALDLESDSLFASMMERLMFFGQLFAFIASHPDFHDTESAEMIHANQFILREKFEMFHNPMPRAQADPILKEVFPES